MPDLGETQAELLRLRAGHDETAREARSLALKAERLKLRLQALERTASREETRAKAAALKREIAALERKAEKKRSGSGELEATIRGRLADFSRLRDGDVFTALDDHYPFLMFPVRLETKFAHEAGGMQLRIRIFPDEINISTHDPLLSEGELGAGAAYWAARESALALEESERRGAELATWTALARRYSGPRARYIARQTRPAAWPPADGSGSAPPAPASAGEEEETVRLSHSIAPPRAILLPDYFIVLGLDHDNQEVARAIGKPIPDLLMLGPDGEAPDAELKRGDDGRLAADPKLKWLIDFASAVDVGMAVTMDVPPEQQRLGFHRIVAIGAKLTMDPEASARALEALLGEHRFTDGIDILPNGAATNNLDGAPSAFTTDLSADEALGEKEIGEILPAAVLDHGAKSDAQRLCEALGIAFEAVSDWPGAGDAQDIADALAMNRALWPATIGRFIKDMMGEVMSPALKGEVERYFLTYVTGRTLLPNIRVGRQPYGMLVTGDLGNWDEAAEDAADGERGEMGIIVDALKWLRGKFEEMGPVGQMGGGGDEALANSMRVIGQNASSVTFASRKAVTDEAAWNTLNYTRVIPLFALNWWTERVAERDARFSQIPIPVAGLPLAGLVFFHEADPLGVPAIDHDPDLPLSEKERISKFDGSRNYIDWLLTASTEELKSETFKDKDGVRIPAPKALLYRLLHNAWSSQLVTSSKGVFTRFHAELVTVGAEGSLVNMGPRNTVPDAHAPLFDTAKLGLTVNSGALGDYLLDASRLGSQTPFPPDPEALALQSQRLALERLAKLSTAKLERLLAEHLDLGSYRLDAWQAGLVSRRLDHMRRRGGRERGLYLGAYGYVEELLPKPAATPVKPSELPESFRGSGDVAEQQGNGGFVHAPSLGHAVTAAVLRNAYLTHSEAATREAMSINLTSRRVRSAMGLVEGMRAGQDLAALLGYQLERGLHENQPLELDNYIDVLRARFPLVSGRLTKIEDGTPSDVIEARNVVDGNDLLEQVRVKKAYPHDIADLPPAGSAEAKAISTEIERLEEALDAVSDLMIAESVHQAVQSNIDRARGVTGAASEGEVPPVPEVAQTPRSGRTFTQRLALHLPGSGAGWLSSPTPRAAANPGLNSWLASQLPKPSTIGFEVRSQSGSPSLATLGDMGLEAIDLVLMSTDRFGDGSGELERYLADRWRASNNVPDEVETLYSGAAPTPGERKLLIDLAAAPGAIPLSRLLPQLRALRRILGSARSLNAEDYRLAEDSEKADPRNSKAYRLDAGGDLVGLPATVGAARDSLNAAGDVLESRLDAMAAAYEALRADAKSFDPTAWTAPLASLRSRLRDLVPFAVLEALPRSSAGTSLGAALGLYEQGRAALLAARKRIEAADALLAPLPAETPSDDPKEENRRLAARLDRRLENLVAAARLVLGGNFALQASFSLDNEARAEIEVRLSGPIEDDPLAIEAWLQSLARVRPRIADVALSCAASQWTVGAEPALAPVQLPMRAGDPWIGQGWSTPPGEGEILSVMTLDAPASLAGELEGLIIDEWTETVPGLNETTGIAFHFDRPGAAAPQAILLAMPSKPDGRWQSGELVGAVVDTFERARLRAIEPDHVAASPLFPILPMALTSFARGSPFASTFLTRDAAALSISLE